MNTTRIHSQSRTVFVDNVGKGKKQPPPSACLPKETQLHKKICQQSREHNAKTQEMKERLRRKLRDRQERGAEADREGLSTLCLIVSALGPRS